MKIQALRALESVELPMEAREAAFMMITHLAAGDSTAAEVAALPVLVTQVPIVSEAVAELLENPWVRRPWKSRTERELPRIVFPQ